MTVVTLAEAPPALRAPLVLPFIALSPGLAISRALRFPGLVMQVALGVPVSLALGVLVSAGALYLGVWSPRTILLVLALITALAAGWDLKRTGDEEAPGPTS